MTPYRRNSLRRSLYFSRRQFRLDDRRRFCHFNRGKRRDIQTEHIRSVTRPKIRVSVPAA